MQKSVVATYVDEAVLSPLNSTREEDRGNKVRLGHEGTQVMLLQSLEPRLELREGLVASHVGRIEVKLNLELGEWQHVIRIHQGIHHLELVAFDIDFEQIDPIVTILLHNGTKRLPHVASFIDPVYGTNEHFLEVDSWVAFGIWCRDLPIE